MIKEAILALNFAILPDVQFRYHSLEIAKDIREVTAERITITSAYRDEYLQARIMLDMYNRGVDMAALYGAKYYQVVEFLRQGRLKPLASKIKELRFSNHLCGRALDIRSWDLSEEAFKALLTLRDKYDIIYETKPPHIHIETVKKCGCSDNLDIILD